MDFTLNIGVSRRATLIVTDKDSAKAVGSGDMPVLATPSMVALMEQAACLLAADGLPTGFSTVGTKLNIEHVAATPIGLEVYAEATLTAIDRRRLVYDVAAYDTGGLIGKGSHERFIVEVEGFMAKANSKA